MYRSTFAGRKELEALAARFGTPFHLYDETTIRQRARRLQAAFAWNPGFREYFAVKATPTPALMEILGQEGCGMDCSSLTELMLARRAGFSGDRIMFSSNVTPREDMALARDLGALINLDDMSHIPFLEEVCGDRGLPERLVLRFNPGNSFPIGNDIMSRPGDAKYGLTRPQLETAFRTLAGKGVRRLGLHAFLSSNTTQADYWPALAELLFRTAVELRDATGIAVESVNLSGGIGIPYRDDQAEADLEGIAARVHQAFRDILVPAGMGDLALHAELGRWLTGPAGCLVARVIHTKHIHKNYLGLDACAADLLRPAMYGAWHHVSIPGREAEEPAGVWDVTGGLCENNDKFALDRPLPRVEKGDLAVIHDTGAHGRSMGYNYNGKLRCGEVLLCSDGTARLIRRHETPQDYFATLDLAGEGAATAPAAGPPRSCGVPSSPTTGGTPPEPRRQ